MLKNLTKTCLSYKKSVSLKKKDNPSKLTEDLKLYRSLQKYIKPSKLLQKLENYKIHLPGKHSCLLIKFHLINIVGIL